MQTVKIEDAKKDCIYYAKSKIGGVDYIFRAMSNLCGYKSFIASNNFYTASSEDFKWPNYDLRFPTTEEADWLVACEQAGKLVPKPNQITRVINDYQIY